MGVIADVTPKHTKTIIGGEKLVAVDHFGAKLMGWLMGGMMKKSLCKAMSKDLQDIKAAAESIN